MTESLDKSSGGKTLTLSPGLIYALLHNTQIYGLIQLPIYQYVNGEQLTADQSLVFGVDYRFRVLQTYSDSVCSMGTPSRCLGPLRIGRRKYLK